MPFFSSCPDGLRPHERWEEAPRPDAPQASVVDTNVKPLLETWRLHRLRPCLPPVFQRFRTAPVGSGNGVEKINSPFWSRIRLPSSSSSLPRRCFSPICRPVMGRIGAKHMEVWVWYAAVLPVWLVYIRVSHHAPAHKVLQQNCLARAMFSSRENSFCKAMSKTVCKLGRSFHARLFPRRSIGSGGLRIRAVHGTAGEYRSDPPPLRV